MMLQGHFVGGLLADAYRDDGNPIYWLWHYCTGITAPVFFTVSGFIFTFLLVKEKDANQVGWRNPRVKKGIRRGFLLIGIAYFLRMSFQSVDVLHCIGLSLLLLIATYLLSYQSKRWVMPAILLSVTLLAFTFEPFYKGLRFESLPLPIANYTAASFLSFRGLAMSPLGALWGICSSVIRHIHICTAMPSYYS